MYDRFQRVIDVGTLKKTRVAYCRYVCSSGHRWLPSVCFIIVIVVVVVVVVVVIFVVVVVVVVVTYLSFLSFLFLGVLLGP